MIPKFNVNWCQNKYNWCQHKYNWCQYNYNWYQNLKLISKFTYTRYQDNSYFGIGTDFTECWYKLLSKFNYFMWTKINL